MFLFNSFTFSVFLMLTTIFPPSKIEWKTPTKHDFGLILRGPEAVHIFTFRNVSKSPLIIDNVRTDCSCTTSDWENLAPIQPDSLGKIAIKYNAKKAGYFIKRATVWIHGQKKAEMLTIQGEVDEQ